VDLNGVHFAPAGLSRVDTKDELKTIHPMPRDIFDAATPATRVTARTNLKTGRVLNLEATIAPARPKVTLLNKSVQPGYAAVCYSSRQSRSIASSGKALVFFLEDGNPPRTFWAQPEKSRVATARCLVRCFSEPG